MSSIAYDGDRLKDRLPSCDTTNPADLDAWYGGFAFVEHWRKIVLANCREIERARMAAKDWKVSEARLDDLARTSDTYIHFLITHLNGRRQWETERQAAASGAYGR